MESFMMIRASSVGREESVASEPMKQEESDVSKQGRPTLGRVASEMLQLRRPSAALKQLILAQKTPNGNNSLPNEQEEALFRRKTSYGLLFSRAKPAIPAIPEQQV
ncbi:hypothetical protein BASA81_002134 [Batrachochytrium salamandrivorans]|nr:hypothetical protein BASA81_002134 [Batrachochytrium salamandrivorans]